MASIRLLRQQPYSGYRIGIVIGIDVGTTFSGVSYAILRPGEIPDVMPVTSFSGQTVPNSKIPSIIYYDEDEDMAIKGIGAETVLDTVAGDAEYYGWFRAEHFKMHLRPQGMSMQTNGLKLGELPHGKTAEQVMGDFLHYLFKETALYIQTHHSDGETLWAQVKDQAIFVLGHPNGWSGLSQQRYRISAILGGLVPETDEGRKRIKFVTEGEASALACLSGGLGPARLKAGFRFVIADAGGGTVDMSTYEVTKSSPVELRECAPPDCRFAGSVFVDINGLELLQRKLRSSIYDDEQTLKGLINDEFKTKTKKEFNGERGLLKVGDRRTRDDKLGIRAGFLMLTSDELAECFASSVVETVDSIKGQFAVSRSDKKKTPVWLVGGFAASPYLLGRLQEALEPDGILIRRPDTNLAKAVANGAILHFLDNLVTSRACKTSYGTTCSVPFNILLSDHRQRMELVHPGTDGSYIGPVFDCIAEKGAPIGVAQVFRESYFKELFYKESAEHFTTELLCYDGDLPVPRWYNENKNKFKTVCKLEADLSELCSESIRSSSMLEFLSQGTSRAYWKASFDIELNFGTTELEARIKWEVKGKPKRNRGLIFFPVNKKWISWFLSSKGNEYFCEVEEDYILDRFNLTGLNTEVQNYSQALDLITDNLDDEIADEFRGSLDVQARLLYGLIHARWIITSRGLAKMLEKYKKADFGRCPRVLCQSQPLLPVGLSDIPYEKSVKLYCGRCEDIYSPKSSRHGSIDGAYFGTSFPHMLFLVYPAMIPPKSGQPDMTLLLSGSVRSNDTADSARRRRAREDPEILAEGVGEGVSTAAAALKAERYRPKIFGFQVHEIAQLQRWQEAGRDRQVARLEEIEEGL
ncbi:hypothetical protein EW145_g2296 [Phellinidium pouzarii]|uniref:Casein kinase II subunit beta n=1 Tax=Phellinidium pouzarii TaxID=167371 RepID=A0A4S4LBV4_9AGAM|nr:hypothetical protein EW145_g2296 [Phellinidium pouzarii]